MRTQTYQVKLRKGQSVYNFKRDYEKFHRYAHRFHERNIVSQDFYSATQSIVEKKAHLKVANAKVDRTRILEIGGGGGEHLVFEKNKSLDNYVVTDIQSDFLEIIKKQFNVTTVASDGNLLPFTDDSFSACIATSVLEHVVQLEKTLLEVKRVLKKDGDFLVVVPTNGGILIEIYKLLVSYPFMSFNGIKKPSYIWHYENVNCFKRVNALLHIHFKIVEKCSIPFSFFPLFLSPLYFFHCRNVK